MMEVNIADLTWAPFIYPRGGKSEETVKAYVEALRVGAKFPPIKVQRVFNYKRVTVNNNEMVAVLISNEATLKRFYKKKDKMFCDYCD